VGTAETVRGKAIFEVGVDGGSNLPVTVTLTATCPAPIEGTEPITIDGGCVTVERTLDDPDVPSFETDGGLSFTPREDLVAAVDAEDDQVLCGALAPPCP
jgi:hypothetical protein